MSFSKDLRMAAEPIIEDIYNDGFIQDLLHGELSKQAVRQYLRADASYLKELETLKNIVLKYDLFLIADEVYREFAYDGNVHHSVLNIEGLLKPFHPYLSLPL